MNVFMLKYVSIQFQLECPVEELELAQYRNNPKFLDTPKMCCNHSKV